MVGWLGGWAYGWAVPKPSNDPQKDRISPHVKLQYPASKPSRRFSTEAMGTWKARLAAHLNVPNTTLKKETKRDV